MSLAEPPIFDENKIKSLTQHLQDRIAGHMRLQREGKLPFYKRIPVTVVEIRHIMEIMNRSRSTAHRLMTKIRTKLGKKDDEYVSVSDFCEATGLPEHEVQRALDLLT